MSLTNEDREALLNGVVIMGRDFIHNPRCGHVAGNNFLRKPREGDRLAGCCHPPSAAPISRESIAEIVAAAVAEARAAALNEAADAIEPGGNHGPYDVPEHWSTIERLSFLSGLDHAARIVRNLAAAHSP